MDIGTVPSIVVFRFLFSSSHHLSFIILPFIKDPTNNAEWNVVNIEDAVKLQHELTSKLVQKNVKTHKILAVKRAALYL